MCHCPSECVGGYIWGEHVSHWFYDRVTKLAAAFSSRRSR